MRTLIHALSILTAASCLLSGCSSPTAPATAAPTSPPAVQADTGMPFPKLEKGMTAEVIRQKLGEPAEIQPMPDSTGNKVEVWIYNFKKDLGMQQVAAGTREVPIMSLSANQGVGMGTTKETVFTMAEKKADITLSLLMFNGRLEVQKAKVEESLVHH